MNAGYSELRIDVPIPPKTGQPAPVVTKPQPQPQPGKPPEKRLSRLEKLRLEQQEREKHWWALLAQPGVTMAWPVVMFHGEFVWFEWNCVDVETRETIAKGMPELEQAVAKHDLDEYYGKALGLVVSGRAKKAFDLTLEKPELREKYGKNTFGQCCLLARRLVEAGTRFVEVVWPKVANSDNHSWDVHTGLSQRMKTQSAPMLDAGLAALIEDLDDRGLLKETLVVAVGEFGRSPQRGVSTSGNQNNDDGRDHWPYCYTAVVAGAGVKRGFVWGKSDKTASAPAENPVHPTELLATVYHSVGIKPDTIVYNHLNQPRELVKGEPVTGILS